MKCVDVKTALTERYSNRNVAFETNIEDVGAVALDMQTELCQKAPLISFDSRMYWIS